MTNPHPDIRQRLAAATSKRLYTYTAADAKFVYDSLALLLAENDRLREALQQLVDVAEHKLVPYSFDALIVNARAALEDQPNE